MLEFKQLRNVSKSPKEPIPPKAKKPEYAIGIRIPKLTGYFYARRSAA